MSNDLSAFTTIGIGGAARRIVTANSRSALVELSGCGLVLGRGSNVLVSDSGYDGTVIINRYCETIVDGTMVTVGSGTGLNVLCGYLAECGLSGMEWAVGIPGSVGGAVKMNAGAFGGQVSDSLLYADVLRSGIPIRLTRDMLGFGYRTSALHGTDIVISATFALTSDSACAVKARGANYVALRARKQPHGKTAGSIFKNPPGLCVGKILDDAGLKGLRIGGAEISRKHANIIVNIGGGTAKDVCALIGIMKSVLAEKGVAAHEEIIYVGGF